MILSNGIWYLASNIPSVANNVPSSYCFFSYDTYGRNNLFAACMQFLHVCGVNHR
jgi:hypothetical protein